MNCVLSNVGIIFVLLFICKVDSIAYNHTGSINCTIDFASSSAPGFYGILPAANIEESIASLKDREYRILSYFSQIALPVNSSLDDFFGDKSPFPTNPFFNSRDDANILCSRWISRILLGCYNNSDLEKIFLDESTRPFALPGSSQLSGPCSRDGDYDFVTINLLQLLYIAKERTGSMSAEVFTLIRDKLLTIFGRTTSIMYRVHCHFSHNVTVLLDIEDTENHVLQIEISRYLTNQLLLESNPSASELNNTLNGNKNWMLKHLATFLRTYFEEYNSRPYQLFTVKALSILHSYANEKEIVQIAEMILNVIGVYSCLQTNNLRRFVPFIRQTHYINETESWQGDSEFYRLAILVGSYASLDGPSYSLPGASREDLRKSFLLVNAVANTYRLNDDILRNFFRQGNEYFVGNHAVMEMYYSTPTVLISGGGHATLGTLPNITFPSGILPPETLRRAVLESIITNLNILERGQTRSTTIVPSLERSMDIRDMMRFEGNKDVEKAAQGRNLCVAPGFACGLQFQYGRIVDPIKDQCSFVVGDWRFFDFSDGNVLDSGCPKYGFYMAIYERQCIQCILKADTYGLVEIVDLVDTLSFESFQQMVIANNPNVFTSHEVHKYRTIQGAEIEFQMDPGDDTLSQLLRVTIVDSDDDFEFNRNYRKWPMLRTSSGLLNSASAVGRWTFDTAAIRTIYDVGNPLQPVNQAFARPNLVKYFHGPRQFPVEGSYFDDSSSVIDGDSIESVMFHYDLLGLRGFQVQWRGTGLQSTHGSLNKTFWSRRVKYTLVSGEYVVEVGIGTLWMGKRRVNRVRLVTNQDRVLTAGYGLFEQAVYNTDSLNVIAFFGQADDEEKAIYKLGVVAISATWSRSQKVINELIDRSSRQSSSVARKGLQRLPSFWVIRKEFSLVATTDMRREALRIRRPRQHDRLSQSHAALSLSTAPIPDIEALHTAACEAGALSYIDPTTGFTCFTRLAHLKRGVCCGSQCRHCPYGWANVRVQPMSQTNEDSGDSSTSSGDDDDTSDIADSDMERCDQVDVQRLTASVSTSSLVVEGTSTNDQQHSNAVTGGSHGGSGTKKNVPYTRTGDRGTAQLLTGERRRKSDATFEALGTVDELCSHVGVCHATLMQVTDRDWERLPERLLEIMSRLFDIGSHVANPRHAKSFTADGVGNGFDAAHVLELEAWIDEMTEALPELSSFVLPTGTPGAAQLHVARTVCRRAERTMVPLVAGTQAEETSSSTMGECDPNALAYVNRLSDFFFTAARWVNDRGGASEIAYRRPTRNATQRTRVTLRSSDEAGLSSTSAQI